MGLPRVSIVMPVFNKAEYTLACLESLALTVPDTIPFELIVVDNGSTDGTAELLGCLEGDVTIVTNRDNTGFGPACNQGAERARGEHVLFLNNDTVLLPGWLDPLLAALDDDARLAAVQPQLLYPDGRLNDAGGLVFAGGDAWVYGKRHPFPDAPPFAGRRVPDYASGACLLVRRPVFEAVGGFDPRYAPAYYEDTDLSFTLRHAGWGVLYEPASKVVHVEGVTAGTDVGSGLKQHQVRNKARFAEKWADDLAERPAMDPAIVEAWAHRPQVDGGRQILVVEPTMIAPDRSAGHVRLYEMIRMLREEGHHVTYFAHTTPPGLRAAAAQLLGRLGVTVYGADPASRPADERGAAVWGSAFRPELADVLRQRPYDQVIFEFYPTAEHYTAVVRAEAPQAAVVLDTVDVHFVREQREAELAGDPAARVAAGVTRERELAACRAADAVVCVTEDDAAAIRTALADDDVPMVLVPVTGAEHDPGPGFADRDGILFVGNFLHLPNLDAVRWWQDEIGHRVAAQLPGVRLTVVGSDPRGVAGTVAGEHVEVVGWVPDTLPWLHRARVSVAPLRYGAGMKGKVVEALGAGLPAVVTPVAAEGMALADGVHALVAADADAFAAAVVRLYTDAPLWEAVRAQGRAHAQACFGRPALRRQLAALVELTATLPAPAPVPAPVPA